MAAPQLILCAGIKVLIILLTIVILILLDPSYTTTYISVNYEIVLIYIVSGFTLLYCVVSIVMYAVMISRVRNESEPSSLTNCSLTEVIFCGAGIIGWMLICGICGTVSQRTIIDTGELFGWMSVGDFPLTIPEHVFFGLDIIISCSFSLSPQTS
ncbi:hypothetical protein AB6A40_005510 [Gnathostoma spinigerum]|uniref:NADH dehydrogenase subunit 6 n=1 Tax=Gnathostoma spinigerum TaxID=75299 RepID=A0ABD6EGG9_9BILA